MMMIVVIVVMVVVSVGKQCPKRFSLLVRAPPSKLLRSPE